MLRGNIALDIVEELRVRQWARRDWVPDSLRDQRWHRIILEEMSQRDGDLGEDAAEASQLVPLEASPNVPAPHFIYVPASRAGEWATEVNASAEMHYG